MTNLFRHLEVDMETLFLCCYAKNIFHIIVCNLRFTHVAKDLSNYQTKN